MTIADRALTIYTSGTTGLPKAANVSHHRLMQWSFWFAGLMNTGPDDRMYDCLPMYHSIGGVVATGAVLVRGGSVVIREKFSAQRILGRHRRLGIARCSNISASCAAISSMRRRIRASASIGLRLCCGNGLRADVWEKFQSRFEIPRILEFYAATEGNVSLYNVEGKVGAIGRVPSFLTHRFPLALVKFDAVAGEPARDADGRCIRCATDEIGEAIGRIADGADAGGGEFEGYTSAAETERKILRDVFEAGDAWYRTGDLMRMDAGGFFYFVDRIGDTFRWKGENVATSEVAAALMAFPGIAEASCLRRRRSGNRRRGRHGGAGRRRRVGFCGAAPASRAAAAGLCPAAVPAHEGPHRDDGNVQAEENRARARRLRSHGGARSRFISTIRSGRLMCRSMPRSTSASRPARCVSNLELESAAPLRAALYPRMRAAT